MPRPKKMPEPNKESKLMEISPSAYEVLQLLGHRGYSMTETIGGALRLMGRTEASLQDACVMEERQLVEKGSVRPLDPSEPLLAPEVVSPPATRPGAINKSPDGKLGVTVDPLTPAPQVDAELLFLELEEVNDA